MRTRTVGFRALVVLALGSLAAPCWAQARPGGPFAGLFGREAQTGQSLDFRGSLFGLHQEVIVPAEQAQLLDPRFQKTSTLGGTSGTLSYGYRRSTPNSTLGSNTFSINGSGTIVDYTVRPDQPTYRFNLGTGLSKATRRVSFTSSASGRYSSTYIAPFQDGATGDTGAGVGSGGLPLSNYFVGPDVPTYSANAGTGLTAGLTRKISVNASASGTYSTNFYDFAAFQSATFVDPTLSAIGANLAVSTQPVLTLRGTFGVTDNLTRRSSLTVQGDWTEGWVRNSTTGNLSSVGARVTFRQQVARGLGFHLGYGHTETRYGDGPAVRNENIDAGIDYNYGGSIALGPRTTVSFGSSTALVTTANRSGGTRTNFRLNGNAGIVRRIGRTWSAAATYTRSLGFVVGFIEPILSDSVSGTFGGQIGPRAVWLSGMTWSHNEVGFDATDSFGSYSARSALNVGVTRMVGAYAQYAYFGYQVPPGSTARNVLSTFSRQSVSVGLSLWVPLLNGRSRS